MNSRLYMCSYLANTTSGQHFSCDTSDTSYSHDSHCEVSYPLKVAAVYEDGDQINYFSKL